jgi:hypothetical protein
MSSELVPTAGVELAADVHLSDGTRTESPLSAGWVLPQRRAEVLPAA